MLGSVETTTIPVGKRDVCVELAGDPRGNPILISYDRPGCCGSTVDPGHTMAPGAEGPDDFAGMGELNSEDKHGEWLASGPCD